MQQDGVDELLAVLTTYRDVVATAWPTLHAGLAARAARWSSHDASELRAALDALMREVSEAPGAVRVFWKLGPELRFGGCNVHFASDAGLASPADLVGIDDFDARLPWRTQAAKYRTDDKAVMRSGESQLGIIERQQSERGISWVRVGKAPVRTSDGSVIGVLGMYELLDAAEGRRLWMERLQKIAASS